MNLNIKELLELDDFSEIYDEAKRVTRDNKGNIIFTRAVIEYSNNCTRNCAYCGINCMSKGITRYRMDNKEIIDSALLAVRAGFKTIILQGGEDLEFPADRIAMLVKEIANLGVAVTVSSGEMDYESYRIIKEAGASRYLLKHETADSEIYAKLHNGYTLQSRIDCLQNLRKLGYEVGSGFIVGLPNQNIDTLVKDINLLYDLRVDMAGISPFIPHKGTVLGKLNVGNKELVKRCVAITRLLLPQCNLPVTTAYTTVNGGEDAFLDGIANVIMAKATPIKYRKLYEIYPNATQMTDILQSRNNLINLANRFGKILA